VSAEDRRAVIGLIDEAVASGARQSKACSVIHLDERRLRNWRTSDGDGRTGGYRAEKQAMSAAEKDAIVEAFSASDVKRLPPKQAFVRLLDRGVYVSSYSTFLRVLKERNMLGVKRHRNRTGTKKRPALTATAPNQVWCWDITWLESRTKGKYFYLYMIIDMYSRKVVGWTVAARENGGLAKALFARTLEAEGISEDQLIVHADNGKPMRSRTLRALFNLLSVTASYGRPHTSNDNAYAESLFATLKGRVAFPEYFGSLEAAEAFCTIFFQWYNEEHRHSGLDYVTPSQMHSGAHVAIFAHRNALLEQQRLLHPTRHGGKPKTYGAPATVRLKHRIPEQGTTMKKPQTQTKEKEATTCQEKREHQDTAAMGCCQEPCINPGLCTFDNRPARQYVRASASLDMKG
jgi:putative transposase